ncbi:MAG: hypothetical protein DRI88_07345 [Bacteroidetes bacterium]|nr:MAG: hypothetical protein DRI88_07345 [Bacteroidota bacterium]RLD69925.1 MAG: hypothetical protein DRI87_09015 [Bacteroidota bacterium]
MKKMYILFIALLSTGTLFSQYTITYSGNCPQIGDAIHQTYFNHPVDPGPAGANQTWDFSTLMESENGIYQAVDPDGTPFSNDFPESNIAYTYSSSEDVYTYGQNSPSEALNNGVGFDEADMTVIHYSDPATLMIYPFSYTGTFTDTYYGEYTISGLLTHERGTINAVADAWGSITTPLQSYNDVLRVKIDRVVVDSMWIGSLFISTVTVNYTDYSWFAPDIRIPVLCITMSESQGVYDTTGYYIASPQQINETTDRLAFLNIYPNPARDHISITFKAKYGDQVSISIIDMSGKELFRQDNNILSTGIQNIPLSLKEFHNGLYLVKISDGTKVKSTKLVIR